jgi:hypothetical protein
MFQKMVASPHANDRETETTESSYDFFAAFFLEVCSRGNSDPLNPDELECLSCFRLHLKTKLNGFADTFHYRVERAALRMTTAELRYGSDIEAFGVAFDNNIKLAWH